MKLFILFFLLQMSSIAKAQETPDPLGHDGGWSSEDEQADDDNGRGLELPENWPKLAEWTSMAKEDQESLALPRNFVWASTHPIRNQGRCGSCWAFATTSVVESLTHLTNQNREDLSEQDVLSCSGSGSCRGGFFNAFNYIVAKGVTNEASFPYAGADLACPYPKPVAKLFSWSYIGTPGQAPSETELKAAILKYGPVAAVVNGSFGNYRGGIFRNCTQARVDHMVVIEGWNDDGGYWVVRNSWGTQWGAGGYLFIAYKDRFGNRCNRIGEIAAFAVLQAKKP
ncbi:MAG: hypothetical protein RLZZ74_3414 [Cyanobacteriota bacterium]|jgi:C1A family cysteine protease